MPSRGGTFGRPTPSTSSRASSSSLTAPKCYARRFGRVLGDRTPVQRCIRHKERNVLDHLPEEMRDTVERRLRGAWALTSYQQALGRLQKLAGELEHPPALPRPCAKGSKRR